MCVCVCVCECVCVCLWVCGVPVCAGAQEKVREAGTQAGEDKKASEIPTPASLLRDLSLPGRQRGTCVFIGSKLCIMSYSYNLKCV